MISNNDELYFENSTPTQSYISKDSVVSEFVVESVFIPDYVNRIS